MGKRVPIWGKSNTPMLAKGNFQLLGTGTMPSFLVYSWVINWSENRYKKSQIFEVRQAHPRTIMAKVAFI